jgi:6-phosphogluconate dehydrogenase
MTTKIHEKEKIMTDKKVNEPGDIGLIGLGVMGRNFALNMADHGFAVVGYDRDADKTHQLEKERSEGHAIATAGDPKTFCEKLRRPRAIMLLVPAGEPVDAVIRALEPYLAPGDLIIDSGNSHFTDTDRRGAQLEKKGFDFMGMGMSGGESGARHGPSLMPGGAEAGYERVRPILTAAAAHVDETPCVAYMGPGSAGHYVKMVHNGIEYGLMQLIAETYDLMKRALGMQAEELHTVYHHWNQGALNGYLMEITAAIFQRRDEATGRPLIDLILDEAKQKGTGEWTVVDSTLYEQVPTPTIDAAVMMRHLSGDRPLRRAAAELFKGPDPHFTGDRDRFVAELEKGLTAAVVMTYAQGMALLKKASQTYGYRLDLETVARVWTGGCIIRAALLEEIQAAYRADPDLANLLLAPTLGRTLQGHQSALRAVVSTATGLGLPIPGLMSALAYWDAYRSGWLPANLVMAQRDYFGSHTYQRVDKQGTFHTQWES